MELSDNINILLESDLKPDKLKLFGLSFGDSINKIPRDKENKFQYGTFWIGTKSGVSYRTDKSKKIIEYLLRENFLEDLKLTSKRRILRKFGNPVAIEKENGTHYYFYPQKKIVVAWWEEYDKIFGIYIGENILKQTTYSVKEFLNKFYEFKAMVPNFNNWNSRKLKSNKPRLYRFLELKSMLKAFEIGTDLLQDFQNRKFLNKRTLQDFKPIINDIEKYALNDEYEKEGYKSEMERIRSVVMFEMLVQSFMRFYEEMNNLLNFNSGVLEAGFVVTRYSINKTQKLLNEIDLTELKEIEDLLCKVIDPKNRIFTKYELIKKFNFPDVDLLSIDMANY